MPTMRSTYVLDDLLDIMNEHRRQFAAISAWAESDDRDALEHIRALCTEVLTPD